MLSVPGDGSAAAGNGAGHAPPPADSSSASNGEANGLATSADIGADSAVLFDEAGAREADGGGAEAADMALDMADEVMSKDDDALDLLGGESSRQPNEEDASGQGGPVGVSIVATSALDVPATVSSTARTVASAAPATSKRAAAAAGASPSSSSSSNTSAVYRWYEIEEGFNAKRREESSIAKCKLCRLQGKLERKSNVRFSKSVTSNLWRHLKENHPDVYEKHSAEKKSVQMHRLVGAKKRGRKKQTEPKIDRSASSAASAAGVTDEIDAAKLLESHEDVDVDDQTELGASSGMLQRLTKKAKRSDQFFPDLTSGNHVMLGGPAHHVASSSRPLASGANHNHSGIPLGAFNLERVREALGHLFLFEMAPFELCSSPAFRNLLVECSGGAGGYIDDTSSFALLSEDIARAYAKKQAADVRTRVAMLMKMTDFAHYVVSEWRIPSVDSPESGQGSALVGRETPTTARTDKNRHFVAFIAVGLDQDFNPFRRCLHVSTAPADFNLAVQPVDARGEDPLKAMADRGVPYKFMPQLLAVESPCEYENLCANYKLQFLESVPMLLLDVMVATINEVHVTDYYGLSKSVLGSRPSDAGLIVNRRLDKGEFVESNDLVEAGGMALSATSRSDELAPTVLDELPASLTGHTYRDLIHKVMFLLAHFKESAVARRVLRRLALEDGKMDAETFELTFVARLRVTAVSVNNIFAVLCLVLQVMPAVVKYFELHRTGDSDRAKLLQLCSLTKYEWSRASYLKSVLKPFADATAKLDGEKFVASSLIVPSVYTLLEKMRAPSGDESSAKKAEEFPEDIQALQALAYANLAAAFGYLFSAPDSNWTVAKRQTFNLLWSATLLDPRTRPFIIKGPLPQHEFWEVIKAEAAATTESKNKERDASQDLVDAGISLDDDGTHLGAGGAKSSDIWDDLQANLASCAQEEMLLSTSKSSLELAKSSNLLEVEVSFFQEEGRIPLKGNPLEWWQGMRMKYPFLARLARYVLSIPCSVNMTDNPVAADKGLIRRAVSQMSAADLCELLAASMNLRAEKSAAAVDTASKQMWSTV